MNEQTRKAEGRAKNSAQACQPYEAWVKRGARVLRRPQHAVAVPLESAQGAARLIWPAYADATSGIESLLVGRRPEREEPRCSR